MSTRVWRRSNREKKKGRDAQQSDVAMMGGKREREKKEVGMDRR